MVVLILKQMLTDRQIVGTDSWNR